MFFFWLNAQLFILFRDCVVDWCKGLIWGSTAAFLEASPLEALRYIRKVGFCFPQQGPEVPLPFHPLQGRSLHPVILDSVQFFSSRLSMSGYHPSGLQVRVLFPCPKVVVLKN